MERIRVIKSDAGEWVLDVLGNPWGGPDNGRDADGEYFDARTKFHEDKYPLPPIVYYHGYTPDGKPEGSPIYIGRTVERTVKDDGVWYRVVLDKANEFARRVWEAAKDGIARASSGSNHLHRTDADGHIREWPVTELSIFDAVGNRQPANGYAVALPVMKAVYEAAGIALPPDIEPEPEAEPESDGAPEHSGDAEPEPEQDESSTEDSEMDEKDVKTMVAESVAEALKADREAREAAEAAQREEQERIEAAVKAEREKWEAERAADNRLPGGAPYQTKYSNTTKYDNLADEDLALLIDVVKSAPKASRSDAENAMKALGVRYAESDKDEHQAARSAMKMADMPLKANELNQSTLANYGDEWVGVAYSRSLWERIWQGSQVVSRLPTIEVPQGMESIVIPVESTPPTFYKVAQASAVATNPGSQITATVPVSKLGTAQKSLTVGKLGAATYFTGELVEDSLIPWVGELRMSMQNEALEVLEHLVIDGDTETGNTANINDIGGQPGGTEAFLLFDGFRKSCLVTTTANSRAGSTLDESDYLETLKLMGLGGRNVLDRNSTAFIQDIWTGWKASELATVKTQDVYFRPTIENGMLTSIWGRDVITTANMHRSNQDATYGLKANSAGKVDLDTAANNLYGAILAVRFDQWRLGWKRRATIETERVIDADATKIVMMMRVGMVQRDTEASAITYGLTL